jgi:hypothetical protein
MKRVFTVSKGALTAPKGKQVKGAQAPMPKTKQGMMGKRVQGGNAPVPYRSHCGKLGVANALARVPTHGVWAD